AREDGQEPHSLQQREGLVLRQLQDPLVEPEPALLAIQIPARRQLVELGRATLVSRQGGDTAELRGTRWFVARARHAARVLALVTALRCDLTGTHAPIVPEVAAGQRPRGYDRANFWRRPTAAPAQGHHLAGTDAGRAGLAQGGWVGLTGR